VRVEVGPLPSASVLAWLDYARTVLSSGQVPRGPGDDVPADATESFARYLAEWQDAALRDDEFHWTTDVPSEVVEYLVLAFFRLVQHLAEAAEAGDGPGAPADGDQFYVMLVHGLLDALAAESTGAAEFADHLRSFWPGLEE